MPQISSEEAEEKHDITAIHSLMPNKELRFRLSKSTEGSGYIRTEASTTGGWQKAHYHESVLETYVVQSGWIVACEERGNGAYRYVKYEAGQVFTTQPRVVHNIYMSAGSVIHTVKHGQLPAGKTSDRIDKAERAQRMTEENKALDEATLALVAQCALSTVPSPPPAESSKPTLVPEAAARLYNDVYRHYDNLIWKTPAWSVAALSIAFVYGSNVGEKSAVVKFLGIGEQDWHWVPSAIFLCAGVLLALLSFTLYRFRWHQAGVVPSKPKHRFLKLQAALNLFISMESLALFSMALQGMHAPVLYALSGLLVLVLALHVGIELSVHGRAGQSQPQYTPS